MTGKAHVLVFSRGPRLGAVKTRLAAHIGPMAARDFQLHTSRATLVRLGRDRRWHTWLVVTPDNMASRARFWPRNVARLPQGQGDLGRRMARALGQFKGGPVVVVGSDIPDLAAEHVAGALKALRSHPVVLGPARDGGYWLIGARNGLAPGAFRGVRWSTRHALADTLANLTFRTVVLPVTLEDVDDGAALARWQAASGDGTTL